MIGKLTVLLGTPIVVAWMLEPAYYAAGFENLYVLAAFVGIVGVLLEYPPWKIQAAYYGGKDDG